MEEAKIPETPAPGLQVCTLEVSENRTPGSQGSLTAVLVRRVQRVLGKARGWEGVPRKGGGGDQDRWGTWRR